MRDDTIYLTGHYLEKNPTWHEEDSPWKAMQILKFLESHKISPTSVCEIGCGAGEILNRMADELGNQVRFSGFEISPQAFEICKKKERPNLRFFLDDPFRANESVYDLAMAIDVIEHLENYFEFLRQLKKVGVYKILHIPLDLSVQTVLRSSPILRQRQSVGHIHYFTKETALAALKDTGYEIIDYVYTRGSLELPNRGWKSNLLKLPRRLLFTLNQDIAVRLLGRFSLLVLAT